MSTVPYRLEAWKVINTQVNRKLAERFSVTDDADFERIGTALRAELARRPAVAGIASYRPVLDPQTRKPITAIVSARRAPDGTITLAEIAGDWDDPRVVDLETWAPPGEPS